MRVIIATDFYQPVINGVSTFSRSLAEGLSKRGHEIVVVAPSQTGRHYEEMLDGYRIVRVKSVRFPLYRTLRVSVYPAREIKTLISHFRPDIVHTQTPLGVGYAARRLANKMNIPVVATNHGMPENIIDNFKMLAPISRQISYILKEIGGRFYSDVNYLTMPTQAAIDMFIDDVSQAPIPIRAISNGIDLSHFKPAPCDPAIISKFAIPQDRPIVMYVGRLDGEKHASVLLRAMWHVLQEDKNVHLLIVGHGNDSENLHHLAKELALEDHVAFTGRVTDGELVKLYSCGSIFAMPSPAELQCIAMLEAMASGLPVVAVNAGALYEICQNGRNGYLCEVDNEADMADKIYRLLQDKDLRTRMGSESIAIAREHDILHTLTQFEEVYKAVLNQA